MAATRFDETTGNRDVAANPTAFPGDTRAGQLAASFQETALSLAVQNVEVRH